MVVDTVFYKHECFHFSVGDEATIAHLRFSMQVKSALNKVSSQANSIALLEYEPVIECMFVLVIC